MKQYTAMGIYYSRLMEMNRDLLCLLTKVDSMTSTLQSYLFTNYYYSYYFMYSFSIDGLSDMGLGSTRGWVVVSVWSLFGLGGGGYPTMLLIL